VGTQAAQTLAVQTCGAVHTPQVSVPPQPSGMVPQFLPWAAQVVGTQAGGGTLANVPAQRVWFAPQVIRRSTALPAATVPATLKLNAVARTSGAAWAANGAIVPVPEMPPPLTVPRQPGGGRAGSMLIRPPRARPPSAGAAPTAGKRVRLGFTPPLRLSVARRMAPMQAPPAHASREVVALPSVQEIPLFRFSQ